LSSITKNKQYYKFSAYGFLKNLRFFDAFFILFLLESGLSYTQIGILYGVREIVINIFEIPSGIIADTYGRKASLIASFIIYISSFIIFYFFSDFWLFMLAFILYGVADAFRSGTHKGMIMDYLKINHWSEQKIAYYGYTRSWSQKGSAISSLLAGGLVFYSGEYYSIFLYSIVPYILNLLLILSYPQELNKTKKQNSEKPKEGIKAAIVTLFRTIKQIPVLTIIHTSATHTAYLKAVKDYIQPLMVNVAILIPLMADVQEQKKNGLTIGLIYFLIYLITSRASQLASLPMLQNHKHIPFITLLLGLTSGVFCGIFYQYDLWLISLVFFVGIYFIESLRKPILTGFITDQVPGEILTSVISVQNQLRTIITAILAMAFGMLADIWGIGLSFIIISLVLMAISGGLVMVKSHSPKS